MRGFLLTPAGLQYQAQMVLAIVLTAYLFLQSRRGGRRATLDLARFLAAMTAGLTLLFLDQVFRVPRAKVFIDAAPTAFLIAGAFLLSFAYRFPDSTPDREMRLAVRAAWVAVLACLMLAGPNLVRSLRDVPNPSLPFRLQLVLLLAAALWIVSVFLRRALGASRLHRRERDALGAFAGLVAILFLVGAAAYLANLRAIPQGFFVAVRTVGFLIFLFAFVVVHLNASPEPTALTDKIVGLCLVATLLALVLAVALLPPTLPERPVGIASMLDPEVVQHHRLLPLALLILCLPAVVLLVFPYLLTASLRRPLGSLLAGIRRVNEGDLGVAVPVRTDDEIGYLARSFNGMVRSVREAVATRERMAAVERELAIARRIQESLFPTELPRIRDWEFAAACRPAREVGGDYYDVFPRGDGQVVVALGDVAGKGVGPAMVMAGVRSAIRSRLASGDTDPGRLLTDIGNDLFASTPAEIFVTLFVGILDPASGSMRYASAGHPPPILIQSSGETMVRPEVGGPLAGAFVGAVYEEGRTRLGSGGVFVLFSDGLTEASDESGEMYEEARIVGAMRSVPEPSATAILARLLANLEEFRGGAAQSDDVTILVLRRGTAPDGEGTRRAEEES